MAGSDIDDPYIPTPEEFAEQQRAKKEQASSNIVVKVFRMMNAEIGRVKQVFSPGSSGPAIQKPSESAPTGPRQAPSFHNPDPLIAEQKGLGFTPEQQAIPDAESPKVKRSINISPDVVRRRGDDIARPK